MSKSYYWYEILIQFIPLSQIGCLFFISCLNISLIIFYVILFSEICEVAIWIRLGGKFDDSSYHVGGEFELLLTNNNVDYCNCKGKTLMCFGFYSFVIIQVCVSWDWKICNTNHWYEWDIPMIRVRHTTGLIAWLFVTTTHCCFF